jgi:cystathionine beta-lyase family protein involved in aluminum resistance
MTDGASVGVNVAPEIVEAFFVFATKAIRGAHCIPSVFATVDVPHSTNTMFQSYRLRFIPSVVWKENRKQLKFCNRVVHFLFSNI